MKHTSTEVTNFAPAKPDPVEFTGQNPLSPTPSGFWKDARVTFMPIPSRPVTVTVTLGSSTSKRPILMSSTGFTNSITRQPPNTLSFGVSSGTPGCWIMRRLPWGSQLGYMPPRLGSPPSPMPGPAGVHPMLGAPRSGSPSGLVLRMSEELKTLTGPMGCPVVGSLAYTRMPHSARSSSRWSVLFRKRPA